MSSNPRFPSVEYLVAAGIGVCGALLSLLLVDVSLGLADGFDAAPLRRMGHRVEHALPWLSLAPLGGLALGIWYRRLVAGKSGLLDIVALCARAFLHFPLFGMVIFFGLVLGLVVTLAEALFDRLNGPGRGVDYHARGMAYLIGPTISLWLWFLMPIPVDRPGGGSGWPGVPSCRRMLHALPLLALAFLLFPVMESEDSGERVSTRLVTMIGGFWFADYLLVELLVVSWLRLRSREGGGPASGEQA